MNRSRSSSSSSQSRSRYLPRQRGGPPFRIGEGGSGRRTKRKDQSPQEAIDEFWDKFTTKKAGKVTTIIPHNEYAAKVAERALKSTAPSRPGSSKGVRMTTATSTEASYEEAAVLCREKVAKIVEQCRRVNQKYKDPHFDLEFDLRFGGRERDSLEPLQSSTFRPERKFNPGSVRRVVDIFEDPHFYIDGPTANDVRQGHNVGDCWLMAALCTLSNKPGLIEKICVARDQDVGVYGFVFHRDGEWFSEIIDDKLYLSKPDYEDSTIVRALWDDRDRVDPDIAYRKTYLTNSGALYFAQCEHPNETWLPLLEKAYAKAVGDYGSVEGGFVGEGIEDLSGGVTSEVYTSDILDREKFWAELQQVNKDFLFGCSTGIGGRGTGERDGIMELHSYSVMKAVEIDGYRLCLLKNPWGKGEWKGPWSDGSKEWTPEWMQKLNHRFGDDGAFWIQFSDLMRKYQAFDRTRLFGPEWKVASIWTTLSVPWTLDYHDTHFNLVLTKSGPVVIVLSQIDDRYFRGLAGQYTFELSFRVHKSGQSDYVVRSQTGYRLKRSVNVELDLAAGSYDVLVKIDAHRDEAILPVEDVVKMNAKTRREKLTRIGLSYDLAHSKGKIEETPEEIAAREKAEKRRREKEKLDIKEKLLKRKKEEHVYQMRDYKRNLRRHYRRKERKRAEKVAKAERMREMEMMGMGMPVTPPIDDEPELVVVPVDQSGGVKDDGENNVVSINTAVSCEHEGKGDAQGAEQELKQEPRSVTAETESQRQEPLAGPEEHGEPMEPPLDGPGPYMDPVMEPIPVTRQPYPQMFMHERPLRFTADGRPMAMPQHGHGYGRDASNDGFDTPSAPSSVSDITDHILDLHLDQDFMGQPLGRQDPIGPRGPPGLVVGGLSGPSDRNNDDDDDQDPWNAVAVVGLRVFYKVDTKEVETKKVDNGEKAENTELEDKEAKGKQVQTTEGEEEVVKLKVIRPNIYEDSDDDEKEEGEDGEGEGSELRRVPSKGLDVDDSAKDATLKGEDLEVKKKKIKSEGKRPRLLTAPTW